METYPLDLVLAVVTASATIFLGFLPANAIRPELFAREAFKATAAWIVVAAISPLAVMHYPFILAVFCFIAWWNFQREEVFTGKIWLSLASGLGISVGVLVILAVTPGSWPSASGGPGAPYGLFTEQGWDWSQAWRLASLYLGGAIIGLAYAGYVLCREASVRPGLGGFIQNCLGLLLKLTLVRGGVILVEVATVPGVYAGIGVESHRSYALLLLGISIILVIPSLAYFARRAAHFSSRLQPTSLLVMLILVGLATEIAARLKLL